VVTVFVSNLTVDAGDAALVLVAGVVAAVMGLGSALRR
jgi:hypothetical protein